LPTSDAVLVSSIPSRIAPCRARASVPPERLLLGCTCRARPLLIGEGLSRGSHRAVGDDRMGRTETIRTLKAGSDKGKHGGGQLRHSVDNISRSIDLW